jgi:protein-tyrosine kinase
MVAAERREEERERNPRQAAMSTTLEVIPHVVEWGAVPGGEKSERIRFATDQDRYACPSIAEQQIAGLVRQIFLRGRKRNARQVLFSAVDEGADIATLCMMVGNALNQQNSGTTCVIEAVPGWKAKEARAIDAPIFRQPKFGILRDAARQLRERLWFMPSEVLREDGVPHWSASWIRGRLAELRLDFDYTILQGPAVGSHDEACLLSSLCDGIVLVLRANSTRRLVAQKVTEKLQAANIRILGAVMTERTFPIPEAIYRKL